MNYFIGIDMGTTSTKAVAFDEAGEVVLKLSNGYTIEHPQADWHEQDPELIFNAVITGINSYQPVVGTVFWYNINLPCQLNSFCFFIRHPH